MTGFITARQNLINSLSGRGQGPAFVKSYTHLMDQQLQDLLRRAVAPHSSPSNLALVALGGYGRGELAPYSDVDLLFLTATSADQETCQPLIEAVLYPLWDFKLTVGHAVRTPSQCVVLAQQDLTILASLLDARLIFGDQTLFADFEARLHRYLNAKANRQAFFSQMKTSVADRHRKYGASPYLLEPNVKEGPGALRDLHAILWISTAFYGTRCLADLERTGFLSRDRVAGLVETRDFMTDVRMHLHRLAGTKADALTFDMQEGVSRELGYQDSGHLSPVEAFMREYYTQVYRTKASLDYFLSRVQDSLIKPGLLREPEWTQKIEKGLAIGRGQIELSGRAEIEQRPLLLMRAFEISATSGLPISQRTLELIRTNLGLVNDEYRQDPKVAASFLRGLAAPARSIKAVDDREVMQDLDLLAAYIPELAAVRAQVQHDAYHVYTVDVHQMMTFREIKKMAIGGYDNEDQGFDRGVSRQVRKPEIVALAALLHDIGKGHGQDHARRGAEMIPAIGLRLGLSPQNTDDLKFLVAQHLYMFHIALRRDLTEEKLIINCARHIGDVDRLHMLYLITAADARATGPGVLNNWKKTLLRDLYSKIFRVLTKSDLARLETAERTDRLLLDVVKFLEARGLSSDDVDAHVQNMSAYYLSVMTDAEQIVGHVFLERQLQEGRQLVWQVANKEEGLCEVTVATPDRPGLLSRMAGVFTLHNINIFGAQVFTRPNGIALDIFQVGHPPDREYEEEAWQKVERDALRVLTGHLALDYRLSHKQPLLAAAMARTVTHQPDKVVVDNETSDFYTIVEVYTYDRLGLLYELTKTLFDLQLSIHRAKIATKVEQVVDVFYVRDFFGQKVTDPDQIQEIKEALFFTLER